MLTEENTRIEKDHVWGWRVIWPATKKSVYSHWESTKARAEEFRRILIETGSRP